MQSEVGAITVIANIGGVGASCSDGAVNVKRLVSNGEA